MAVFIPWCDNFVQPVMFSLCLMFALITDTSSSCVWTGRVTATSSPFSDSRFFSNTEEPVPVNDVIKDLQVFHLMPPNSEVVSAYGYYILAEIACDDPDETVAAAKALFLQGGTSVATITVPSQSVLGNHLAWKELSLEGALVELNDSCQSLVCSPAWVVPVPVWEDHHVFHVDISTRGGLYSVQPAKFTVNSDGYWRGLSSEESPLYGIGRDASDEDEQSCLDSCEASAVNFLPRLSSPSFLAMTDRLVIFTTDSFQENVFVKMTTLTPAQVCAGGRSFAITLADRFLYGDHLAVFEVFGRFASAAAHVDEFQPIRIAPCIQRMFFPPHSHLVEWSVYAVTGEEADDVYQALLQNGEPLTFSRVADDNGAGACNFIMNISATITGCSIKSSTPSATTLLEAFFLVEATGTSSTVYNILLLTGTFQQREWRLLATIPVSNCTEMDSDLCLVDSDVILTDITATARPSKHLFVWGNVVIHSPDEGVTWYHLADYNSPAMVTLLTTSSNGQLVILNEEQEIWYGSCGVTVSLVLLRPSIGWELNGLIHPQDTINRTVSIFFDNRNLLREVFIYTGNKSVNSISSCIIPAARILQLTERYNMIDLNSSPNMDGHLCPFKRLSLVAQVTHSAERKEYYDFSPPRLTNGTVHDQESLLVYQGLLHLVLELREQGRSVSYAGDLHNPMEQWLAAHQPRESYHEYLYMNRLLHQGLGVYVPLTPFTSQGIKVKNGTVFTLPPEIFLDKGDVYNFHIQLKGWPLLEVDGFDGFHGLNQLLLAVDVSHLDLLEVGLERHEDYLRDTVEYSVTLRDLSSISHQAPPGQCLMTSSVSLEVWGSALKCFNQIDSIVGGEGLLTMNVIHGCPPGRILQYDINATILYNGVNTVYDCPLADPLLPCVYFKHEFHPQFVVMDLTTGSTEPFVGPYTLKVIGGQGPEDDQMKYYTTEEIALYNWNDKHTQVWTPIDASSDGGVAIFDREHSGLIWRCKQLSPCGERPLNFPWAPEYIFLVEVTNKDIRSLNTYCDYTVQFLVKIHGLPISSRRSIRIVVWCLVLSFSIIGLFLVCDWNEKRVWRRFKKRAQRGFRVHPRMGSTEWKIHKSSSTSVTSAPSYECTLATRRRFDGRGTRAAAEVIWNLEGSWLPPGPDDTLQEVAEELVTGEEGSAAESEGGTKTGGLAQSEEGVGEEGITAEESNNGRMEKILEENEYHEMKDENVEGVVTVDAKADSSDVDGHDSKDEMT